VAPLENGHIFMKKLSLGTFLILNGGGYGGGAPECKNSIIIDFMNNISGPLDTPCMHLYEK